MSFTIYQASAGSGKTFSLAKEYLKISLKNPDDFKHILAVTFTNKAAAEMKERIIKYLVDFADANPNNDSKKIMLPILMEETGLDENTLLKRASILLKKILYNYPDFSVMTIDSFFQRILRTFAYDLDIPVNFQLEIQFEELLEQVIDLLIDNVGQSDELTNLLIKFINSKADDSKNWHIEKEIFDFAKQIYYENSRQYIDKLHNLKLDDFNKIIHTINNERIIIKKVIKETILKIESLLNQANIDTNDFSNAFMKKWIDKIKNEVFEIPNSLKNSIEQVKWFSKPNATKYESVFYSIKDQLITLITNIKNNINAITEIEAIRKNIYPIALLNEIKLILDEVEKQDHTFQISDTNFKIHEITSNESTPFIYERLGDKYHYYFIDEFQDTSRLQWLNLLPLICEAISSYQGNNIGKAILFGDAKQAIYRFRGGNIEQFVKLPNIPNPKKSQIISQFETIIKDKFNSISLDTNYRSLKNIIEFNNHFFASICNTNELTTNIYNQHIQKAPSYNSDGGMVSIKVFDEKGKEYIDVVQQEILAIIEKATKDGFKLSDIAILTRDKKNSRNIADFLSSNNINIVSTDSLLLTSSIKVILIISLLKYRYYTNNQVLASNIIVQFNLLNKISNSEIKKHIETEKHIENYIKSYGYNFNFSDFELMNLYEKTEYLVRVFGFDKNGDIYVLNLLNIINEYLSKGNLESKFWDWWKIKSDELLVVAPDDIDGVKIMTIHKSKGLEFPIVILPIFKEKSKPTNIWVDFDELVKSKNIPNELTVAMMSKSDIQKTTYNQLAEEETIMEIADTINILYVALTRPIERLYLITEKAPVKSDLFSYQKSIENFINSPDYKPTTITNDNEFIYGIEEPKKKFKNKSHTKTIEIKTIPSENWTTKNWISESFTDTTSMRWGKIVHFALSIIYNISDVELAIQTALQKFSLNDEEFRKLNTQIENLINLPQLVSLFNGSAKVLNEAEIVDNEGAVYRPDRVIISNQNVTILDFKTGQNSEKYKQQLSEYKKLFSLMEYKNVKAYLVFISEKIDVIEV